ncbi:MAG: hypothetical protein WC819_04435 [Parcubacteria group bacterium]|jgi:Asp-tRNA(Asn)/Glu-tRNA(Gln) amidotransferase B subunit
MNETKTTEVSVPDELIARLAKSSGMDEKTVRHLISVERFDVFAKILPNQTATAKYILNEFENGRQEELLEWAREGVRDEELFYELMRYFK